MMVRPISMALMAFVGVGLLGASACDEGASDGGDDAPAEAVLPGKADNYLSPTSQEYAVWGLGELALDASWAERTEGEREAEARTRLEYRFKAYAHFINAYVVDKTSHDSNDGYGEFAGYVRGGTLDFVLEPVDDAGLLWAFIWEFEMGGPRDMMDRLPIERDDDGQPYFDLQLPSLSEDDYRLGRYAKTFDPAKYEGELDTLQVRIDPKDATPDAWPEYARLAEDGLIDIVIVVGGDYNDARYDLKSAESHFAWLKKAGFAHTAKAYTDLTLASAPFTSSVTMNGTKVSVNVRLLYPDIVPDAELPALGLEVEKAYESADVVIYDGHAGLDPDYSGVVYHYNPRHAISATDLAKLDLPEERYQIFVFNGCKTYGAYPEAVYASPTKDFENLDVVSTVSFSWLSQQTFTTSGFLVELLALGERQHDPRTWREILTRINQKNNSNVYYGVHGIEDNPHINPYADASLLCGKCASHAACGGAGNLCVGLSGGGSFCGAECTADDGCPDGYRCSEIAVGGRISGHQCLPATFACE